MRDDPASRILSVSYKRDRREHVKVMMEGGRRLLQRPRSLKFWPVIGLSILIGALAGLLMESYRRFILKPVFGIAVAAPPHDLLLQILPYLLLGLGLLYWLVRRNSQLRVAALMDKLSTDHFVDVDIFTDGISITSGATTFSAEWRAFRNVVLRDDRLELEGEVSVTYLPRRAFKTRQEFDEAVSRIQSLWDKGRRTGSRSDAPVRAEPPVRPG